MQYDQKSEFSKWVRQPSPTGSWVYRGQPAKYENITPSRRRPNQPPYLLTDLFEANLNLAQDIARRLTSFPIDVSSLLELMPFQSGIRSRDQVQPLQIFRAIAQHYLHNTDFIDITFDAHVALFFGLEGGNKRKPYIAEEDILIFRWPAKRLNKLYLSIPCERHGDIGVVDLACLSEWFLRPYCQRAAVAMPVSVDLIEFMLSGPHYPPIPNAILDLANIECCDTFRISPYMARALQTALPTQDAMFPNEIDFGYSFAMLWSFLSITCHNPDESECFIYQSRKERRSKTSFNEANVSAVVDILEHEARRLFVHPSWTRNTARGTVFDALQTLELCRHTAVESARQLPSIDHRKNDHKTMMFYERKQQTLRRVLEEQEIEYKFLPLDRLQSDATDWIEPEIERRFALAVGVGLSCNDRPVYASSTSPDSKFEALQDSLRESVNSQQDAVKSWLEGALNTDLWRSRPTTSREVARVPLSFESYERLMNSIHNMTKYESQLSDHCVERIAEICVTPDVVGLALVTLASFAHSNGNHYLALQANLRACQLLRGWKGESILQLGHSAYDIAYYKLRRVSLWRRFLPVSIRRRFGSEALHYAVEALVSYLEYPYTQSRDIALGRALLAQNLDFSGSELESRIKERLDQYLTHRRTP